MKPATTRSFVLALTAAGFLCLNGRPAAANPDLQDAKLALADLDYEQALARLNRAYRWGRNSPEQMTEILRLLGQVQAALGDAEKAQQHFFEMLSLDPSAVLPVGSSPKLTEPFGDAKLRTVGSGRLGATCELDPSIPAVRVTIQQDPSELVDGARAIYRLPDTTDGAGNLQTVEVRGRNALTLALPAVDGLQLYCALIDKYGNQLLDIGSPTDLQTLALPRGPGNSDGPSRSQPVHKHWVTWSGLALATAGAGGLFAFRVASAENDLNDLNENSAEHEFSEAKAIEDRGRRNALLANISLGVAGACAVVAVIQFIRRSKGAAGDEQSALIAPTLVPGGAGVALTTRF